MASQSLSRRIALFLSNRPRARRSLFGGTALVGVCCALVAGFSPAVVSGAGHLPSAEVRGGVEQGGPEATGASSEGQSVVERVEAQTVAAPTTVGEGVPPNSIGSDPVRVASSQGSNSLTEGGAGEQGVSGSSETRGVLLRSLTGMPQLASMPIFQQTEGGKSLGVDQQGNRIFYTVNPVLQARAESLLKAFTVPWGALVAIDPKSGKILAIASYSSNEPNGPPVATRATFPAASLFKVVTSAAAIETAGLHGQNIIRFRGGNYDLGPYNYLPDAKRDQRSMSLSEALGKSVNPVFARVALNNLSAQTLRQYAVNFGFNTVIPFEVPLQQSTFTVGYDNYDIARTAAGFGSVFLSPVHAAMIAAAVGNDGKMLRPYLVDRIENAQGSVTYQSRPAVLKSSVMTSTAGELLHIMKSTVETGTARKHFARFRGGSTFPVAAKTGTLSGDNPKGLYHWFIATAPVADPSIAIATLVIDPGTARIKAGALGSRFLQYYHALETEGLASAESTVREAEPVITKIKRRESVLRQARSVRAATPARGARSFTPKPFTEAVGAARKPSQGKAASTPPKPVKKSKSAQKQLQSKSVSKKGAAHKGKERG